MDPAAFTMLTGPRPTQHPRRSASGCPPLRNPAMPLTRRQLLQASAVAGLAAGVHSSLAPQASAQAAASGISVGVMGVNGRGFELAKNFATQPGCSVAYLCDV